MPSAFRDRIIHPSIHPSIHSSIIYRPPPSGQSRVSIAYRWRLPPIVRRRHKVGTVVHKVLVLIARVVTGAAYSRTPMCVVFSSHSFWASMDVPAGVTQEQGNTGFSIHLLSAVLALIFLARRIQPFLSLVDREVEFCVLTI